MDQKTFEKNAVRSHRLDATFEVDNGGHVLLGNPSVRSDDEGSYLRVTIVKAAILKGTEVVD